DVLELLWRVPLSRSLGELTELLRRHPLPELSGRDRRLHTTAHPPRLVVGELRVRHRAPRRVDRLLVADVRAAWHLLGRRPVERSFRGGYALLRAHHAGVRLGELRPVLVLGSARVPEPVEERIALRRGHPVLARHRVHIGAGPLGLALLEERFVPLEPLLVVQLGRVPDLEVRHSPRLAYGPRRFCPWTSIANRPHGRIGLRLVRRTPARPTCRATRTLQRGPDLGPD